MQKNTNALSINSFKNEIIVSFGYDDNETMESYGILSILGPMHIRAKS